VQAGSLRFLPLALLGLALSALCACGSRTAFPQPDPATGGEGGGGAAGGEGGSGGAPAKALVCTKLALTEPLLLGPGAGRVALTATSADGQIASALHAEDGAVVARALEPWGEWPPPVGDAFVLAEGAGEDFAVARAVYGKLAALVHAEDADEGAGLYFMPDANASAAGPAFWAPVEMGAQAATIVQGYEAPPVAFNYGFLAELLLWDVPSGAGHELRHAVSSAATWYLTTTVQHADVSLLCSPSPTTGARAVRAGSSWLVAGAGTPGACSDEPPDAPQTLVVKRLDWGPVDTVDWTVETAAEVDLGEPLELVRIAAAGERAYAIAGGQGSTSLLRLDQAGEALETIDLGAPLALGEIAPLGAWPLTARVEVADPAALHLEARDESGAATASLDVALDGDAASLSLLSAHDGDAVLVAWSTSSGLRVARLACEEAS